VWTLEYGGVMIKKTQLMPIAVNTTVSKRGWLDKNTKKRRMGLLG